MSYIGQGLPTDTFSGFTTDSFSGDGSATTFTLSKAPFSEDGLIVVINNVIQQPTTNFTVSGTTLTIVGTAVATGNTIYAIHTSGAVPSTLASKVDVNGLSDGIILDADADTTISADTDDQIDFKLGGVDEMTMSSSGIVINEGSNDRDFRVESNGKANMLFVDGGNDRINMGASTGVAATVVIADSDSGQNTVDANGNTFVIEKNDNCGMTILSATNGGGYIHFGDSDDADIGVFEYNHDDNTMRFTVNGSERARFLASGSLAVGTTSIQQNAMAHFYGGEHSYFAYKFETQQTSNNAYNMWLYNNYAGNSASQEFLRGQDPSAVRFFIATDGGFYGNGTYGSVSDERIKQDITDANSQWDDIKALKVRNFKKKVNVRDYGDDALVEIGLVAQEVEKVSPKLIEETLPDNAAIISDSTFGTLYTEEDDLPSGVKVGDVKSTKENVKAIKYSIVHMKALKALQEAQTRIETLETKVKALEDA